jgi:hypothetical protein
LGAIGNVGSLHSDCWGGTTAELAPRDAIGIYPVEGWSKGKPYGTRRDGAKDILFLVVPLVVFITFFLIADSDSPSGGIIRVHSQDLTSLAQSLRGPKSGNAL